jgi:arginyl-tRNA synthetase
VLRWAADLGRDADEPGEQAGELLGSPAERTLLGLLSWLPVRVAAAARRHRPDELPGYLEAVAAAWLAVRQVAPALPFGGHAAPADRASAAARLLLASAVRAVLASGLALTGASVCARDD